MRFGSGHLAYCTNIHPAESWDETFRAISIYTMAVRDAVGSRSEPYAIGLRLSSKASLELLQGSRLTEFRRWLDEENAYVFTINGFPYGDFHGARVKEQVFRPDWSAPERLDYTKRLFTILAAVLPQGIDGSVSTLPGSHKTFHPEEAPILAHLDTMAAFLDDLSESSGQDFHLGLEPEPLGYFENTTETLAFFDRLTSTSADADRVLRRLGINYDACHFALQYEDASASLDALVKAGIRISKIHLSSALSLDPRNPEAIDSVAAFDEPVYFHQVLARNPNGTIQRFVDLPDALADLKQKGKSEAGEWRVHFHIPLDTEPVPPLYSTRSQVKDVLDWSRTHPEACSHFEIETYTWGVLPERMHRPVVEQIACEYRWVWNQFTMKP